jgi:hypothetical protein
MSVTWSWYVNRNRELPIGLEVDTPPKLDGPLEKLIKLFPVEVVTVYVGADQFARAATGDLRRILLLGVAILGLVLLPGAYSRFRKISLSDRQGQVQIAIGLGAFFIWVYAQGALAAEFNIYNAALAGVLVFGYLGVVMVYGPAPKE